MNPTDCNYRPPPTCLDDFTSGEESRGDAALHTDASAAAFDAALDSLSDSDHVATEVDASSGANKNFPKFPSPPPPTSSAVHIGQWSWTSSRPHSVHGMARMDLNNLAPGLPHTRVPGGRMHAAPTSHRPPPQAGSPSSSQHTGMPRPSVPHGVPAGIPPRGHSSSGNRGVCTPGERHSEPQTLSSDTSAAAPRRQASHSTGVRKKSSAAMKLIADATFEGSEKLVAGLKDINDTAKELKREQLALDTRIHEENLWYQKEKDKLLLENSKLSLLNQTAVVAAMTSLADVIRIARNPPVDNYTTTANPSTTHTAGEKSVGDGTTEDITPNSTAATPPSTSLPQ
jgi:hypothetical protein